ncbi:hypothetical protein DPEC_G00140420 [Dallia pectoralis]|uniref:Uncharacterized protein n=1 Tax=Dallia pectoralis TaxID=75939 RepID=A0ACC2GMC2_DALPE|nr:hypothetical protein DPEC_G00140420 [Dallia pectoralis]
MASVNRLTRKLSLLDDSDDILLNLVAKSNWGQSEQRVLTGSFHKEPESQLYHQVKDHSRHSQSTGLRLREESLRKGSPASPVKTSEGQRVTFNPTVEKHSMASSGGEVLREVPKQLRVPAKGHFTPHPDQGKQPKGPLANIRPPSPRSPCPNTSDASNPILHPPRLSCHNVQQTAGGAALPQKHSKPQKGGYRKPLEMLLSVVDRHRTGEKPLEHDHKFLYQAVQIMSVMDQDLSSREAEVRTLRRSVKELKEQAEMGHQDHHTETQRLTAQLEEAHGAVDDLNENLRTLLEENVHLQKQLIKLEQEHLNSMARTSLNTEIGLSGRQVEVDKLRREVARLREEVRQGEKVKELADMLQESHRSLVAANECLLGELDGRRASDASDQQQPAGPQQPKQGHVHHHKR